MASLTSCTFKKHDERQVAVEIELMAWSPKMDLIALSNAQKEVALYRLSWQKVWTLPPPSKDAKVTTFAWRPDCKVLAIGYSTGRVILCDTENNDILHTNEVDGAVTSLVWTSEENCDDISDATLSTDTTDNHEYERTMFTDDSATYLPRLWSLNKTYATLGKQSEAAVEDSKKIIEQEYLTVLLCGTSKGQLNMFAFGIFLCAELSVPGPTLGAVKVISAVIAADLATLSLAVEVGLDCAVDVHVMTYKLEALSQRRREMHALALKFGQIHALLACLSTTIRAIVESWEDVLTEIDSKLTSYAKEKHRLGSGTVSDDFLELLVFGIPSDELHKFLLHDLTEKGIKKLGLSIEHSYSNIQKLILKHLQHVSLAICYHLDEVLGMARWKDRYEVLGLEEDLVFGATQAAGCFMLKATELQQVIDGSMKSFKSFFRWLYTVILRLSDESVPAEISKISQQELNFVADFLRDKFTTEWENDSSSTFNLERIGQYLQDADLQFPTDRAGNSWTEFVADYPQFESVANKILHPYPAKKSLVQQHNLLKEGVNTAFCGISAAISKSLQLTSSLHLFQRSGTATRTEKPTVLIQKFINGSRSICTIYSAEQCPSRSLTVLRQNVEDHRHTLISVVRVCFSNFGQLQEHAVIEKHVIIDAQFYNDDTLTVLLSEDKLDGFPVMTQVSLKSINIPPMAIAGNTVSSMPILEVNGALHTCANSFKRLERMNEATALAVSGTRKVSCVLFANCRRVRIFEMDADEDDEDPEGLTSVSTANATIDEEDNRKRHQSGTGFANDSRADASDFNTDATNEAVTMADADLQESENNSDEDKENSCGFG